MLFTLSKTPFINLRDSPEENSLARSIASFMETTGGISVRNSSSKTAKRKIAKSTFAIQSIDQFVALFSIAASTSEEWALYPAINSSANP